MFRSIRKLVVKVSPVVIGIALWQFSGIQDYAMKQFRVATAWASFDGTGELKRHELQLEKNLESLTTAREKLQIQQQDVASKEANRLEELARLDHLLACFRAASITGRTSGFPQTVFTRSYTEPQILTTVQDLLNRRKELQGLGSSPLENLSQAVDTMDQRILETRRHLENMPVYEALAAAGNAAGNSGNILTSLTSCLQANQTLLASPVTAVTEAVAHAPQKSTASSEHGVSVAAVSVDAAEFLKPTEEELQAPKPVAGSPTVSELQEVLRNLVLQAR